MDFEIDEDEQQRLMQLRRMSHKLARNRSRKRLVRKLHQTVQVVPVRKKRRPVPIRQSLNRNKRLTYILLLGFSLMAFAYDTDPARMSELWQSFQLVVG